MSEVDLKDAMSKNGKAEDDSKGKFASLYFADLDVRRQVESLADVLGNTSFNKLIVDCMAQVVDQALTSGGKLRKRNVTIQLK